MNWTAISAVSDVVAAATVVVSLLYVAIQLRQNTKAIVANSRQHILDGDLGLISEYMTHAIDPHLIGDEVKLPAADERRFTCLVVKALRIREFAWHQYQAGHLDELTWQSYMAPVPTMFATKRAQFVLEFYTGSPEFMQAIRAKVAEGGAA